MKTLLFLALMLILVVGCSKSSSEQDKKQLQEVQRQIFNLEIGQAPKWVSVDSTAKGYQKIATAVLPLFVKPMGATQYLDGYKVEIGVGNPYVAAFSGFTMSARWDKSNQPFTFEEATNFSKLPNSKSKTATVQQYTEKLSPGSWTKVELIITPAAVEDLKNLKIAIDLNDMSLPATQSDQ